MARKRWHGEAPRAEKVMSDLDVPALLYVGTSILSAVAIVATLKADIRWIKAWMREHTEEDHLAFKELRQRLDRNNFHE
jgi:hypothetical protein